MSPNIFKRFKPKTVQGSKSGGVGSATMFEQAQLLFRQGQLADAAAALQNVLEREPGYLEALLLLADIAVKQLDSKRAIELCTAAIDRNPDQPLAYYKRGNIQKDAGEMRAALASYDRAVALDPGYANAFCNRGVVLECLEQLQDALLSYDQAVSLNPDDALAYYNRGGVLRALSRPQDALASYDLAVTARPNYAEAYAIAAFC